MISKTRSVFVQNGSILQRMQGSIWMNLKGFSADRETAENAGKSSDEKSPFVTFVLGGPGSGKGTQCIKIADVFGFTHLSAGDLLRKEISSNSEKGQMILDIIKEGKIVPSEVTVKLIQDAIRSSDSNKFLIDGFPRNEENRMAYESIIGMEPNLVLFFDCSTEEMIKRVLSRNQGRVDDNEETIKKRLKIFEDFNLPVINHYLKRGILHRISATGSEEDVFTRVRHIFEAYKALLSNRSNGSSTSTMELKISNFLQKCTFNQLKQIHAFIITTSLHQNADVLSRFLRRSTEFGNMEYSDLVFSHILNGHFSSQVTLWNAMIRGYAFNGPFESGLLIYNEMQMRGLRPNNFTYPYVLHCCSRLRRFDLGNAVNCQVTKSGFSSAFKVSESLLNMFLNLCRSSDSSAERIAGMISARKLFDEMLVRPVDSWNKMISTCVEVNDVSCAQGLFEEMPERDIVSWNAMISGFIKSGDVAKARETFERMPDKNVVSWTSMVAAYGSSGNLSTAREFFDNMPNKNLVSWNTMISCYTQHKRFKEALSLFVHMQSKGVNPDGFTFSSALTACSQLGDLELGRWTRSQITDWSKLGLEVATAMIDLYANCGHVDLAFALFLKAGKNKDVFCWNVMIKSLASHGRAEDAIKLFFLIGREPLCPNEYTFSSVLFACSHAGLVTEGQRIFNTMETDFGVSPTVEHYGCMVDLLSRKGQLAEAFLLVEKMPFEPDVAICGALLGGCRIWGDVKLAERVMKKLNGLKMSEPGIYISLCNASASMGEWPQASIARHVVEEKFNYIGKKVGCSFVI